MANPHLPKEVRFWAKVVKTDGCWIWVGRRVQEYGRFSHHNRQLMAHRVAYELVVGPIPSETLDHLCGNKSCVNPAHLEPVTRGENSRRFMLARKTCVRGHEWTTANTRIAPNGRRVCRACARAHYFKKAAKLAALRTRKDAA